MKYDKTTLLSQATEIKQAWLESFKADAAKRQTRYEKEMKEWETRHKPVTLEALKELTAKAKANQPFEVYHPRGLTSPPSKPDISDGSCSTPVKDLDSLIQILNTIADDEITASALARAGIRDLARTLRRPC